MRASNPIAYSSNLRRFARLALAVVLALSVGCGAPKDDQAGPSTCQGKCDNSVGGKTWVVDLSKTAGPDGYGNHSKYFWGVELGTDLAALGELAQQIDQMKLDALATAQFAAFGAQKATFKIVWDQLQGVRAGWPTLFFADAASAGQGITQINAAGLGKTSPDDPGVQYQVVVITAAGEYVAAPGNLKVIPMLKNTAPKDQKWIKQELNDGDVISYVHPEDGRMQDVMERRASHVAMHYEEGELVHHIDNPNGYGPQYNHAPSRHMPFHAFRFQPPSDREFGAAGATFTVTGAEAQKYAMAARNWGFMTNDLSPFADFFDLRLQKYADLDSFSGAALKGEEIPEVYCSGLAYTNLNLGLNRMQNQHGLGADFAAFQSGKWYFSDTGKEHAAAELEADSAIRPLEQLAFPPYTTLDMLNVWADQQFSNIPERLTDVFSPQVLDAAQVPPEQRAAPLRKMFTMAVIEKPEFSQQIVGAFRQLEWSDEGDSGNDMPVATVENAAMWAKAWVETAKVEGMGDAAAAMAKDAFLGDPDNRLTTSNGSKLQIMAALKVEHGVISGAELDAAKTPMDVLELLANKWIKNRFVPPRIWIDEAERKGGNMAYVGTVTNCELLSPNDGSTADACSGGGAGSDHFAEGGADTHTYAHYATPDGQERTHRRIDASPGPETFGHGTIVTVQFTGNVEDTLFALHVPEHFDISTYNPTIPRDVVDPGSADTTPVPQDQLSLLQYDRYCNAQHAQGLACAPRVGIALQPKKVMVQQSGHVLTAELKFALMDVCEIVDDATLKCDLVDLDNPTQIYRGNVSRAARGFFTATMLDLGQHSAKSDCEVRDELDADNPGRASGCHADKGSGHYDLFHIAVWNRATP
jgi:hypothetical protein